MCAGADTPGKKSAHEPVGVKVGTSADIPLAAQIARMCNAAYGHGRVSKAEVERRLQHGDIGYRANRVLHLAFRNDRLVGCISSTYSPPWTPAGCGHWGLLVVESTEQGSGVASALVSAAEARLAAGGCSAVQIEYEFCANDPYSQRLSGWYEGKLNFKRNSFWLIDRLFGMIIGHRPNTEFRRCRKPLTPAMSEVRT